MSLPTSPDGPDFTNPNGIPDRNISEKEAKLWLLSQGERAAGGQVRFNQESQRWERGAPVLSEKSCEVCRKIFQPSRNDAKYCSNACRQKAARRSTVTFKGGLVSQ